MSVTAGVFKSFWPIKMFQKEKPLLGRKHILSLDSCDSLLTG